MSAMMQQSMESCVAYRPPKSIRLWSKIVVASGSPRLPRQPSRANLGQTFFHAALEAAGEAEGAVLLLSVLQGQREAAIHLSVHDLPTLLKKACVALKNNSRSSVASLIDATGSAGSCVQSAVSNFFMCSCAFFLHRSLYSDLDSVPDHGSCQCSSG